MEKEMVTVLPYSAGVWLPDYPQRPEARVIKRYPYVPNVQLYSLLT
jgi:hypothetical protein